MMHRIISHQELEPRYGIRWSKLHLARLERAGQFPVRVRLGPGTVGWVEQELEHWLEARLAARAD